MSQERPEGEAAARFDEILRRDGAALARVAAVYEADPARREDLFQDICLALWQALPRFRGEASPRTFAFRIAHNRGLTHRARRRRSPEDELDAAGALADPAPSPEEALGSGERRARLERAVRRLPLGLRQALALRLEGLSHREIGEVLGIRENNVAVRLTRARGKVRQMLERDGGARGALPDGEPGTWVAPGSAGPREGALLRSES